MNGHPHAERAQAVLSAVSGGQLDAIERQMTDDIVWHVGGNHPLSGVNRSRAAVMGYLRRVQGLTRGSLRDRVRSQPPRRRFPRMRCSWSPAPVRSPRPRTAR
jgi:ketosteroid isomerase-like protein